MKIIHVDWEPKSALDGMQQLKPMEELAYRRILDLIYVTGDKLKDDPQRMGWMTKTGRRWPTIRQALIDMDKITIADGLIHNRKCTERLGDIEQYIAQKSLAGKASAEKRKPLNKNETTPTGVDDPLGQPYQREGQRESNETPNGKATYPSTHLPINKEEEEIDAIASTKKGTDDVKRGSRLSSDWQPSAEDTIYAEGRGLAGQRLADEIENFIEHFTNGNGRNKTSPNWSLRWKRWVRNSGSYSGGQSRPAQRKPKTFIEACAEIARNAQASGEGVDPMRGSDCIEGTFEVAGNDESTGGGGRGATGGGVHREAGGIPGGCGDVGVPLDGRSVDILPGMGGTAGGTGILDQRAAENLSAEPFAEYDRLADSLPPFLRRV